MSDTAQEVWPRTSEVAEPLPSEIVPAAAHGLGVGRKQIVIIGAGFAGIAAARALKRCDADVVLIDRRNHHIFPAAAISGRDRGSCAIRNRWTDPTARQEAGEC